MTNEIVTVDLSKFGAVELNEAIDLLEAYRNQSVDFLSEGLTLNFNTNSGFVFLSDEDYNVGMMNGEDLQQFFSCPVCGAEGFKDDVTEEELHTNNLGKSKDLLNECLEWCEDIKKQ